MITFLSFFLQHLYKLFLQVYLLKFFRAGNICIVFIEINAWFRFFVYLQINLFFFRYPAWKSSQGLQGALIIGGITEIKRLSTEAQIKSPQWKSRSSDRDFV